jgi:hypothetical protein
MPQMFRFRSGTSILGFLKMSGSDGGFKLSGTSKTDPLNRGGKDSAFEVKCGARVLLHLTSGSQTAQQ